MQAQDDSPELETLRARNERLQAVQQSLFHISELASSCRQLDTFFPKVHAELASLIYAENFYIALYDSRQRALRYPYFIDIQEDHPPPPGSLFPIGDERDSPTAVVIKRGAPLMMSRAEDEAMTRADLLGGSGPVAEYWMGIPLRNAAGEVIGAVVVQTYSAEHMYSDEDKSLFAVFASHIALAIDRVMRMATLEQEVAERTAALASEVAQRKRAATLQAAMYRIASLSTDDISLPEFFTSVHRVIAELMYARNCYVALYAPETQTVSFPYYVDEKGAPTRPGSDRPLGRGMIDYVLRTGVARRVDQAGFRALLDAGELADVKGSLAFRRWLGCPLLIHGVVRGAVAIQSYDDEHDYSDEDLGLLSFVASHIARALERRQAADQLQAANRELATRTVKLEASNRALEDTLATLEMTRDELVRSERLASLGAMVAGIAHELNTPIGNAVTVSSVLDATAKALSGSLNAGTIRKSELMTRLADIEHAAELLARNLERAQEQIASFKQVAVDQTSEKRRPFDLLTLVNEILLTLHPTLRRTRLDIGIDVAPGIVMDSYPGPLGQVLSNLINNAVLHAFDEGAPGHVQISASRHNGQVTLSVADNGKGILAEHLPRVFDPFFTTRLGSGGCGLGLHIVYSIVRTVLGGSVRVESTPGAGTRFTFELPIDAPAAQAALSPAAARP
ncbi:ATP-binding protein [Chitinivorax sp. PXF-14]|uniref:GAF domain-containing sensor histidine kinase n=1 Tax=Chitinivorax sp. PXF-14 TaxID=3230488 RepID=UPI0034675DCB